METCWTNDTFSNSMCIVVVNQTTNRELRSSGLLRSV